MVIHEDDAREERQADTKAEEHHHVKDSSMRINYLCAMLLGLRTLRLNPTHGSVCNWLCLTMLSLNHLGWAPPPI
jgi:hypothetical protein